MKDLPVETYAPEHLRGPTHDEHITCVAYSHHEELLASYNDELIYLFDKSMSLGSNPADNNEEEEKKEKQAPQVYEGHRNHNTVKGVNFFGPNSEYVISGSDCGRIFIWKKRGGKLVAMMKGDDSVVNCLEPHPHTTVLATSGIDDTVKLWTPASERILELPQDAEKVMSLNKRRRESHASNLPNLVRTVLLSRQWQAPDEGLGLDGDEDDDAPSDGEYSSDGDIEDPRECIIS